MQSSDIEEFVINDVNRREAPKIFPDKINQLYLEKNEELYFVMKTSKKARRAVVIVQKYKHVC